MLLLILFLILNVCSSPIIYRKDATKYSNHLECGHNRWIKQENFGYFFFKERGLVAAFWVLKLANDG
jgi:hypothetical protein